MHRVRDEVINGDKCWWGEKNIKSNQDEEMLV